MKVKIAKLDRVRFWFDHMYTSYGSGMDSVKHLNLATNGLVRFVESSALNDTVCVASRSSTILFDERKRHQ